MSTDMTAAELDALLQLRNEKLWEIVAEIRGVFREHIPSYVVKEVKNAFLSQPETAQAMSGENVKTLKARAAALGPKIAEEIDGKLADNGLWLSAPDDVVSVKTLQEAEALWAVVTKVEDALAALLTDFDLLGPDGPSAYSAPVYFVGRRYFPSLSEHYWKLLHEIRALKGQKEVAKTVATRDSLTAKWDEN